MAERDGSDGTVGERSEWGRTGQDILAGHDRRGQGGQDAAGDAPLSTTLARQSRRLGPETGLKLSESRVGPKWGGVDCRGARKVMGGLKREREKERKRKERDTERKKERERKRYKEREREREKKER